MYIIPGLFFLILALISSCSSVTPQPVHPTPPPDRERLIPPDQVKISPETDAYPPRSETSEYEHPVTLPYPVNTAGAEDSAFITPDGRTLYVWFTPDVSIPAEGQVADGVTGIYVFHRMGDGWSPAERVILQDPGVLALDGCEFVQGEVMWFCTVREGYTGIHWFRAERVDGSWRNWTEADFNPAYQVGELHITADGQELYFHSDRPGGYGGYDIWVSAWGEDGWGIPQNVLVVNSPHTDGWPFVTEDGLELWFTRGPGAPQLYRSKRVAGVWMEPELMFSQFAGEASLDRDGNVYFTHHFYKDEVMLEADIYVAYRKEN